MSTEPQVSEDLLAPLLVALFGKAVEPLGSGVLMEEVGHSGQGLGNARFYSPNPFPTGNVASCLPFRQLAFAATAASVPRTVSQSERLLPLVTAGQTLS